MYKRSKPLGSGIAHRDFKNANTDGWVQQVERWGVTTNNYRKLKKDAYQRQRQITVYGRKRREIVLAQPGIPVGRLDHLAAQIERINNVQAG